MSKSKIKIDQLDKEVQSILAQFEHGVKTDLDDAMEEVAEEAVKKLKSTSPTSKRRGKKYKNGWKVDKDGGHFVINNKIYRLTHLLENGHDIIIKGEKRGYAPAQPHIKPVEEWCQKELPEKIRKKVEG